MMIERDEKLPFSEVLDALFGGAKVPVHLLFRLSDLTREQMAEFHLRWQQVDNERRHVIARHLADISEENFVVDFSPLLGELIHDPLPAVRVAALDGLWDSSDTALIDPILRLLQSDESVEVRAAAAAALAHYVLMAEWGELPRHISPPIAEALLAEYEKPESDIRVRRAALEALGAASHPRVPSLIDEAYEHYDPEMRLSAVFAMGSSADTRWLPYLADELSSPEPEMRVEAARAAGAIGSSDLIENLAGLMHDEEYEVQLAAVGSLGRIGGDWAAEILNEAAMDPEFERLHEEIDAALEEMDWLGGEINLFEYAGADEDDDELLDLDEGFDDEDFDDEEV